MMRPAAAIFLCLSSSALAKKSRVLTRAQLATMEVPSLDAVGESSQDWLTDDVLRVDAQLVFPGKGIQYIGEVAAQ